MDNVLPCLTEIYCVLFGVLRVQYLKKSCFHTVRPKFPTSLIAIPDFGHLLVIQSAISVPSWEIPTHLALHTGARSILAPPSMCDLCQVRRSSPHEAASSEAVWNCLKLEKPFSEPSEWLWMYQDVDMVDMQRYAKNVCTYYYTTDLDIFRYYTMALICINDIHWQCGHVVIPVIWTRPDAARDLELSLLEGFFRW